MPPPPPVLGMLDIRSAAVAFSRKWKDAVNENAEAKSFWDDFFSVFGISRLRFASFEVPIRQPDGQAGRIDLLWRGILMVEHKSRGRDLDSAYAQAKSYFNGLKERDLPKYVIVSDFERFRLFDLVNDTRHDFTLSEFADNIELLGFMSGWHTGKRPDKGKLADIEAAELLGKLHDELKTSGYSGHQLEVLLVRLLFCMFSEDNALFERRQFQDFVESRTQEDGSDVGSQLNQLFEILNTPTEKRNKNTPATLAAFPYVNGEVFSEQLSGAFFTSTTREQLLECCAFDWTAISPEIFGSLFQSIMSPDKRRELGAHYTSETNILKALNPLFLEALELELEGARKNPRALRLFHDKLSNIRLLDPACGCGNFLVVAYREIRRIELEVLRELHAIDPTLATDISLLAKVDVDQMAGIEIEEFPAQVARVALWLTDHQANRALSLEFGKYFVRLPLKKSAKIHNGNALRVDWATITPLDKLSYIVGNPPFIGSKMMTDENRGDLLACFGESKSAGILDFVSAWYAKAAECMRTNPAIKTALVSTNSITQGEQVAALWGHILSKGVRVHFAHRTFKWTSEARGKAAVHCVIIGMAIGEPNKTCKLYDYAGASDSQSLRLVSRISPYLIESSDLLISSRSSPLCPVPEMVSGNQPIDDGIYLFTPEEKAAFLNEEPGAVVLFKKWLGGEEFINGIERWFLLASLASPAQLRSMPKVLERIQKVRAYRLESKREQTRKLADFPTKFQVEFIPTSAYLALPEVSSERRQIIPAAYLGLDVLCGNKLRLVNKATLYHFGVIVSSMHMAWMRTVSGRLKSDYQYSVKITYNNFPWPKATAAQVENIEAKAKAVLEARAAHPGSTLADLYDPLSMPANLADAHAALDRAVEKAYTKATFAGDPERVSFLFKLYEEMTSALAPTKAPGRRKSR
jgi:hypothetical protein